MTDTEALAFATVFAVLKRKRWVELAYLVDAACAIVAYDTRLKRALTEVAPGYDDVAKEVA